MADLVALVAHLEDELLGQSWAQRRVVGVIQPTSTLLTFWVAVSGRQDLLHRCVRPSTQRGLQVLVCEEGVVAVAHVHSRPKPK